MKQLALLASIFFSHQIAAVAPAWSIQPRICVTQKAGDTCKMSLNISVYNIPKGEFCLLLNGQQLECFQHPNIQRTIPISINTPSLLELKNSEQHNILSQNISIKYLKIQQNRRRIREPWSLF